MSQNSRPDTPAQIAAALRVIADQLDAMPDRDQPSPVTVTVQIQPHQHPLDDRSDRVAQVDRYAMALFGQPGRSQHVYDGRWQHTTAHGGCPRHASGLPVQVFVGIDPPVDADAEQMVRAILTPDAVAGDRVDYEAQIRGTRTTPSGAAPIDLGDDPDGDIEGYDGALHHLHSYAGDGLCDCERAAADPPQSSVEPPEAASEINERYPSPAPLAEIEAECARLDSLDLSAEVGLSAQRDLWEDHARIAHRELDRLRAAIEVVASRSEQAADALGIEDSALVATWKATADELRRALAGTA